MSYKVILGALATAGGLLIGTAPSQALQNAKGCPFFMNCSGGGGSGAGGYKVTPGGTVVFSGDRIVGRPSRPAGCKRC